MYPCSKYIKALCIHVVSSKYKDLGGEDSDESQNGDYLWGRMGNGIGEEYKWERAFSIEREASLAKCI